jgi:L-ascorbate oxidase
VIADLADGLQLNAFQWYAPVTDEELTGRQTAQMTIDPHEGGGATLGFDGVAFDHGRMDRVLTLGDVEEWVLTSNRGRHPFHIHVNPFQVMSIIDREGRDVSVEGSEGYDAEFAAMVGGWRDTVMVERGYTVTIRTRYRRFIGDFVLHCHFASHGDEGMMQHVRVSMPGDHDMATMSP